MSVIQYPPNPFLVAGTVTATVVDNNGAPSTVLDAALPFTIEVKTEISKEVAQFLGGKFEYAAYAESIGPGEEKQIGGTEEFVLDGVTQTINEVITVKALELPDNLPPGHSGAYKLVVLLTHRTNAGAVTDIAAVVDGPVLRIS